MRIAWAFSLAEDSILIVLKAVKAITGLGLKPS